MYIYLHRFKQVRTRSLMDRALGYGPRGCGFDSRRVHGIKSKLLKIKNFRSFSFSILTENTTNPSVFPSSYQGTHPACGKPPQIHRKTRVEWKLEISPICPCFNDSLPLLAGNIIFGKVWKTGFLQDWHIFHPWAFQKCQHFDKPFGSAFKTDYPRIIG